MRLWSLHPRYLDRQGLTACWREALLAQAVLAGRTKGYTRHPQLQRFRQAQDPSAAIGDYLAAVADEADRRGYHYDRAKVESRGAGRGALTVTTGQLSHEWGHLTRKLEQRSPDWPSTLLGTGVPEPHPLFQVVPGDVEAWEVAAGPAQPPGE
ncbi:MAG TPA: pyrimidine dimer DNA glycosylase/endonuclease V [Pedococcus sp.]